MGRNETIGEDMTLEEKIKAFCEELQRDHPRERFAIAFAHGDNRATFVGSIGEDAFKDGQAYGHVVNQAACAARSAVDAIKAGDGIGPAMSFLAGYLAGATAKTGEGTEVIRDHAGQS